MIDRRRARRGWGLALGAAACALLALSVVPRPLPGDELGGSAAPGAGDASGVGAGFTIAAPGDDPDLTEFRADVDRIVEAGGIWIRFGVRAEVVVAQWGVDSGVRFDVSGLDTVARAAEYARGAGLAVYLISADGDPRPVPTAEYERSMRTYWQGLAQTFAGDVAVWQIFNEPDGLHYRTHTEIPAGQRGAYYSDLGEALATAGEIIGALDPTALVTTNVSGWPIDEGTGAYWREFFDATADGLDVLGLSAYPQLDPGALDRLPGLVEDMEERYGKPTIIAEVGLQTCPECFTPAQQGAGVSAAVEALVAAGPLAILVYQLRDDALSAEPDFGILYSDGRPKAGAAEVLDAFPEPQP